MTAWGRRLVDHLGVEEREALQSAMWNGRSWSIPRATSEVLATLVAERLVVQRAGIWVLTLHGHRHRHFDRRAAMQPVELQRPEL